jgi:hypothetical protein
MSSNNKRSKRKRVNAEISYDASDDSVELGIVGSRGGTKITRQAHASVTRLNSPKRTKTTNTLALEPVLEDVPSPEPPAMPQTKRKQVCLDKLCDRHYW